MTLARRLRHALSAPPERTTIHAGPELEGIAGQAPAAVLIAFTDRPQPGLILTQRPQWLRAHAGQVAFPGGKVDDGDISIEAAALREAEEELGLLPAHVDVVGQGDDYVTHTGYRITPIIGVIPPDLAFDPNPDEVESWFEVPAATLLADQAFASRRTHWQGQWRDYYEMMWLEHRIWGVTAHIIVTLGTRLRGVLP